MKNTKDTEWLTEFSENHSTFSFDYFITIKLRLLPENTLNQWEYLQSLNPPVLPEFSTEDRKLACQNFMKRLGVNRITSNQTIRKWFGLQGKATPDREMIFRLAHSLFLSPDELEEYLTKGIGENGIQINDYREMVFLYNCKNHFAYTEALRFIQQYEESLPLSLVLENHNDTEGLWKQYRDVSQCNREEFLQWMLSHATIFKGYSLTTLHYFQKLKESILETIKKQSAIRLDSLLSETDFSFWLESNHLSPKKTDKYLLKYLKQSQSGDYREISQSLYQNILELYKMSHISPDSNKELLLELYASMDKKLLKEQRKWIKDTFHLTMMDFRYLSEIFTVGEQMQKRQTLLLLKRQLEQKRKDQRCPATLKKTAISLGFSHSGYTSVNHVLQWTQEALTAHRPRCRTLRRTDILCLIFYYTQLQYYSPQPGHQKDYEPFAARSSFKKNADDILRSCQMAVFSPETFPLDALFWECFHPEEISSLADVLELIIETV